MCWKAASSLLLGIANGVLMFVLALFVAFFFYVYGEPIAARLRLLLHRIAGDRADRLIAVTGATVRGVVYGILGTAVVQGILTAFGLWLSGVPRPVLLGAVAGASSPCCRSARPLVWIPAALWLMSSGHLGWGIFLVIYGVVAVSGADSLIRPWFIARGAQLPFLLTVLGVLGGALAFGLLGIFLGPCCSASAIRWSTNGRAMSLDGTRPTGLARALHSASKVRGSKVQGSDPCPPSSGPSHREGREPSFRSSSPDCLQAIPVLLVVGLIAYAMFAFVGDPVPIMLGQDYTEAQRVAMVHQLGLDQPFFVQYAHFIWNALHGDFGISYRLARPVGGPYCWSGFPRPSSLS